MAHSATRTPSPTVEGNAAELGRRLLARQDEIAGAILRRIRQLAPDAGRDGDPERVEAVKSTIGVAVHFDLLRIQRGDPGIGAPPGAWKNVRLAAHNGMSLSKTLQSYVIGHLVTWEFIVGEASRLRLPEHERVALLKRVSLLESTYFNELIGHVSDEYTRELERVTGSREQRRARLVRQVLEGGEVQDQDLGYELEGEHIGLVVSANEPDDVIRRLASALGRPWLAVSRSETTLWAWLGGERRVDPAVLVAAATESITDDSRVICGEPAGGVDGFRLTHRQACAAYAVAQRRPARVTRYADVSLVSLILADDVLGSAFVNLWLGPLDEDPRRAEVLRETLRAYFVAGQNAASAASAIGVSDRTVASRLRAMEDKLGHSINSRRAELETALRLEELSEARTPDQSLR